MDYHLLLTNLTNPTLLFFLLGIIATVVKSDLEIPESISKFIALYLLFSIGFKGGQELTHSPFTSEIVYSLLAGLALSALVPLYTFFILKRRLSVSDAAAIAATYGSVSAVTFVAATGFLEGQHLKFGGHMVAVMALMESPAIIVGVLLLGRYDPTAVVVGTTGTADAASGSASNSGKLGHIVRHSFTNGSVLMVLGSLVVGLLADSKQAEGIKPFTTDIYKGFLAIFLLEMGMVAARRFAAFARYGWFVTVFALVVPVFNGCFMAIASQLITSNVGNRFMFAVLAASASYIAVPAAMRLAAPKADPGLYLPMALGVTFPFNITLGMPLYLLLVERF